MRKKHITCQWLSAVVISLLMFSAPAFAGSLEPSAPPAPTMKTLDQAPAKDEVIPPWSQSLRGSERFKLVLGGAAVLDKETGLVWEQNPDSTRRDWGGTIYSAFYYCNTKIIGGRKGWRLPTIQELASLVDSTQIDPSLPIGHPFSNVQASIYWSATTYNGITYVPVNVISTKNAWGVYFYNGYVTGYSKVTADDTSIARNVWCVRGGSGLEVQ